MRFLRTVLAPYLIVWCSAGCYTYQEVSLASPRAVVVSNDIIVVKVSDSAGTETVRLQHRAWVRHDSLVGVPCRLSMDHRSWRTLECATDSLWAVSLTAVKRLEIKRLNVPMTVGVSVGILAIVIAGIAAYYASDCCAWGVGSEPITRH